MRASVVVLFAVAMLGCGGGGGGGNSIVNPPGGGNGVVTVDAVGETSWNPDAVTIAKGQAVTFRNNTNIGHNVTFNNVAGRPSNVPTYSSGVRDVTFQNTGTFPYQCTIHPAMTGSVTVP